MTNKGIDNKIQSVDYLGQCLRAMLDEDDEDETIAMLLSVASDHIDELNRRKSGILADAAYFHKIRLASALTGALLEDMLNKKLPAMKDWFHGKQDNFAQAIATMLSEALLDFGWAILDLRTYLPPPSKELEAVLALMRL